MILLWDLKGREPGFQIGFKLQGVYDLARFWDDVRHHPLSPLRVGQTDDRAFLHLRSGVEHLFHLPGINIFSPGNNHVLDPVHDIEIPVLIHHAHVTAPEPVVVPESSSGSFGVVEVALHDVAALHADFTLLALFYPVSILISELNFHPGHLCANGTDNMPVIMIICDRWGGLGHAVSFIDG